MTVHFAFLRAINVGGHNVKMDVLRRYFEALNFAQVQSFIASGNMIFTAETTDRSTLTSRIEQHLEAQLGYPVAAFLRSPAEVGRIATYQPFSRARLDAASALNVLLLRKPLNPEQQGALAEFETDIDAFHVHGTEVYWMCAVKQSDSKFTNARFEKKLGVQATARGIRTMRKLATKYPNPHPQED